MIPILVLVVIAAAPAAWVLWQGRALARYAAADDAVLAERMVAAQRRTASVMTAGVVALLIAGASHAIWTIPLMLLLSQAADYPARRRIHGESWSLTRYLSFTARSIAAVGGFWILLAATPWLIWHAGEWGLAAAAALAAALTIWNARFQWIFLTLFRAKPLTDAALAPRFAEVMSRARVPAPRLWRCDPRGGLVPTAFALPSLRGGAVLFMQPLLDRLTPDEIAAVFAHEVAHLEQFTRVVLVRLEVFTIALILGAVLLVPLVEAAAPAHVTGAALVWPAVVFLLMLLRGRAHQPLELAGDRRAAELCGNPEAVASGLMRLYALTRMPRRLDVDLERWATHPSLARRVQALRALSTPDAPAEALPPVTVVSSDGRDAITFDAEGVRFASAAATGAAGRAAPGMAGPDVLRYADLHELRLEFRGQRSPVLVARDKAGRVTRVPLREEDAPAVHAVLDRVDVLLAAGVPAGQPALTGRVLASAAALLALFSPASLLSVFAVALPAAFRPARSPLAAAAAASLTGGAWLTAAAAPGFPRAVTPVALLVLGAALAWVTLRIPQSRRDDRQHRAGVLISGAIAVGIVLAWLVAIVLPGITAWRLHQAANTVPALTVLPFALGAALAAQPTRRRLQLAAAALACGGVPLLTGSAWFVRTAIRDPLVLDAPVFASVDAAVDEGDRFPIPQEATDLQLSPGGRWVAASIYDYDGGEEAARVVLRGAAGIELEAHAERLAFVGDTQAATVTEQPDGVVLALRQLESGFPEIWSIRLPGVLVVDLDVSGDQRWRISGWSERNEAVQLEGRLQDAGWREPRWPSPGTDAYGLWFAADGPESVWLAQGGLPSFWRTMAPVIAGGSIDSGSESVTIVNAAGVVRTITSELRLNCVAPPIGAAGVACSAYDGRFTRVFRVGGDAIRAVALVRGRLWLRDDHPNGTLTGMQDGELVLLQPSLGRVVRIDPGTDQWWESDYNAGRVAFSTSLDEPDPAVEVAGVRMP